ncbi:MAG: bifunctional phosphoglucose/phosphomannose isomerase [Promethearchaeati archaeon SRVP18_Atabeyarchaeia-1]
MPSPNDRISQSLLDDLDYISKIDAHKMRTIMLSYPESSLEAFDLAEDLELPSRISPPPRNIVFLGMGGSSIGGSLIRSWASEQSKIPIALCQDYHLPNFVDRYSFVVAISYSGNTEETLSAFIEAVQRGCTVVSVASGGKLMEFSDELNVPCVRVPPGLPPRGALPYLFMPLLSLVSRAGIYVDQKERDESAEILRDLRTELRPESNFESNRAKKVAFDLFGFIPVVYGWGRYVPVAQRIKTQFNENSKIPAFWSTLPEGDHNDVIGWDGDKEASKKFCAIIVREPQEPEEIWNRIESTKRVVLADSLGKVLELKATGQTALARIFSVLYLGDFTSLYMAVLRGVDPTPVKVIDRLKIEMAGNLSIINFLENKVKKMKSG